MPCVYVEKAVGILQELLNVCDQECLPFHEVFPSVLEEGHPPALAVEAVHQILRRVEISLRL